MNYSEIINIGCAEGYYAVGLAMRIKEAKVYAYDTDEDAITFCKQMAQLNNVFERVVTGPFCDKYTLQSIPVTTKAFIICDCEGCEKELFKEEIVPLLANYDLLIEIHDFIDIEISPVIEERFTNTHSIEVIQSIDDIAKAYTYHYEEIMDYDLATRRTLLAEHRPAIMKWFYLTPE
jgi:hypothetical protein